MNETNQILVILTIYLIFPVLPLWGIFRKAGLSTTTALITAIIPFYNIFFLLRVAGLSGWWVLIWIASIPVTPFYLCLSLIWVVNLFMLSAGLAKNFGLEIPESSRDSHSVAMMKAFGCLFLIYIFQVPLLYIYAFGPARYEGNWNRKYF